MSRHSSPNDGDSPYANGYLTVARALKPPGQTLTVPGTSTPSSIRVSAAAQPRNHPSRRPLQTRTAPIPIPIPRSNNTSSGRDPGLYSDTYYHRSPFDSPSMTKDSYPHPRRAISDSPCSSLDLSFGSSSSRRSDDDAPPPPLARSGSVSESLSSP